MIEPHEDFVPDSMYQSARAKYATLWNSINGKRATWESNPWVWVLTFRRLP
jgi:hypothetical protein